jgi:hypothetical protein
MGRTRASCIARLTRTRAASRPVRTMHHFDVTGTDLTELLQSGFPATSSRPRRG